jgi:glycosyltransferase involved in cell wall biosynthesis
LRVCFFAAVEDPALFKLVEFYRQDIEALQDLGHEVHTAHRIAGLVPAADVYWVWWPTSGAPAVLLAKLRRRPVILVTALSERDTTPSGLHAKPPWTRLLFRMAVWLADLTLATSDDTREGLVRYRSRALRTAHLSVDTKTYSPDGRSGTDRLVLTISHLTRDNVERKRILDVVRTAAALRDRGVEATFVIAGEHRDGAAIVECEIKRLALGAHVTLLGRVSAEEKISLLRRAAVYFQPTTYEAFGMAVAEAMACGCPVVSNAVGAVPEVVGGAGILLPGATGPEDYAAALQELLSDPEPRRALGSAGRERICARFGRQERRRHVRDSLAAVAATRKQRRLCLPREQ